MSYDDGWSALNLEMPKRVPRTEFSAQRHWELVEAVTEIAVDENSPPAEKENALYYNEVYEELSWR